MELLTESDAVALGGSLDEAQVRSIVQDEISRAFVADDPGTKAINIIASKGTLDWAYPPLILSTTAAALGMGASIFFTFYGLDIIHKNHAKKLKVAPVGNPAVPLPDLAAVLPGMSKMATTMMKRQFKQKNVVSISDLLEVATGQGVKLIACQMTMDAFGYSENEFVDGVTFGGAAAFLSQARRSHVTLFV